MLSSETIAEIKRRAARGDALRAIARDLGVSRDTVRRHLNPEKHAAVMARNKATILDRSEAFRERRFLDRLRSLILLHCESAEFTLEGEGATFTATGQFRNLRTADLANALGAVERGAWQVDRSTLEINGLEITLRLVAR